MKNALEALPGINSVAVARDDNTASGTADYVWSITFQDPVGDVALLTVDTANLVGNSVTCVPHQHRMGVSPLGGSFIVSFGAGTTGNIPFEATAAEMKTALEEISTIGTVDVQRNFLGNGHRWTVTFLSNLGNLPMMNAQKIRQEIQTVESFGGDPTPLGGSFTLSYGNVTTSDLSFDVTAAGMKAALEALPGIGIVDVDRQGPFSKGRYRWKITFRTEVGNLAKLVADYTKLTGTTAMVAVVETDAGNAASLTSSNTPQLRVYEKVSGLPSYTGQYTPTTTGSYSLAVRHLQRGGLRTDYFDNQWLQGNPAMSRVDATINFNWGSGLITQYGRDYVSARWHGKVKPATSENYTFYAYADDGVRMWIDHVKIIDSWDVSGNETVATVPLTANKYHDIRVEYKEVTGTAIVSLQWSSFSVSKQYIPSSQLYYPTNIVGSPFGVAVVPGAADFPHTTASGPGLVSPVAGIPATFTIQAKDANQNNKTIGDYAFDVSLEGPGGINIGVTPEYIGGGQYKCTYTAVTSGSYKVNVKMGGTHIYCGQGAANKCSPFDVTVAPGPTSHDTSDATGLGLTDAVAGTVATYTIQAKDVYGNNRLTGGEASKFTNVLTLQSDSNVQYQGVVDDLGNGRYTVTYTALKAGLYNLAVKYGGLTILTAGTKTVPTPLVVQWNFYAPTSLASGLGLSQATVAVESGFTVHTKDAFSNPRRGDRTGSSLGSGTGQDDVLKVTLTGPGGATVETSSAVQTIQTGGSGTMGGTFTVTYDGATTRELRHDISAPALKTVLSNLHSPKRKVEVTRTTINSGVGTYNWTVVHMSELGTWTPAKLTVTSALTGTNPTIGVVTLAHFGDYPIKYTPWIKGSYSLAVTDTSGVHISGSPFALAVDDGVVHAPSSTSTGQGLVSGVAGNNFTFTIQAKDTRKYEQQTIMTQAAVVSSVEEQQKITCSSGASGTFDIGFRGVSVTVAATDSATQLRDKLQTLSTIGSVTVAYDGSDSQLCQSGNPATITFAESDLTRGPLPLLTATTPSGGGTTSVALHRKGETAFRQEEQRFQCSATGGTLTVSYGGQTTSAIAYNRAIADFQADLIASFGQLELTVHGTQTTICHGDNAWIAIRFLAQTGNLGDLTMNGGSLTGGTVSVEASYIQGIHPLWGNYIVSYNGSSTANIAFDASASAVKSTLEALTNIGGVTVTRDEIGLTYKNLPVFYIYTVTFDSAAHPLNMGDLPLIQWEPSTSSLQYEDSGQFLPFVLVRETEAGTTGNNREDGNDLENIDVVLTHQTSPNSVSVGKTERQAIVCSATGGTLTLSYDGSTYSSAINYNEASATTIKSALEGLATITAGSITVDMNGAANICAGTEVFINFAKEHYDAPMLVINSGSLTGTAEVREKRKGSLFVAYK